MSQNQILDFVAEFAPYKIPPLPSEYRGQTAAPVLLDLEAAAAARARLLGSPVAGLVPPPPSLTPPADFWRFNHRPTAAAPPRARLQIARIPLSLEELFLCACSSAIHRSFFPPFFPSLYDSFRGQTRDSILVLG